DLGPRTDVLENLPKAQGLLMLLRAMSPQVLAADEITHPRDIRAVEEAAGCGVSLLVTAHGRDRSDLDRRPLYRDLLALGVFRHLVTIGLEGESRTYRVVNL
ncbi:MAG: stage III sporulation protein AB, partial [Ruminiclostridium sp.]|nr:stage III sporulation protein AB [Ruminiclostridium sp.]